MRDLGGIDASTSIGHTGPRTVCSQALTMTILHWSRSVFNGDCFDFSEEVIRVLGSLSTYSRTLHPPERKVQLSDEPAVGPDQA